VGQTVGFQVRLESSVSARTICTFCTYGVLLRALMSLETQPFHITHIIVDEIHERDKISDFLLIELRSLLVKHPHLRLILMSASMNLDTFQNYFRNCVIIEVPGRMFEVDEVHSDAEFVYFEFNSN
jgi:HrpA-like RNA helicase